MDAGIYLEETATRALVGINNIIDNSCRRVYSRGAAESMVRENKIIGDATLRVERGNGVNVWTRPARAVDNDIPVAAFGFFKYQYP